MRVVPEVPRYIDVQGRQIAVDEQGFLIDPGQWTEEVAAFMADQLDVALTPAHWTVIRFMRDRLEETQISPDARHAFRYLEAELPGVNGKKRFFELFPKGYVSQACRIPGMRQPRAWSTG